MAYIKDTLETLKDTLSVKMLGSTLYEWLLAAIVAVLVYTAISLAKWFASRRLSALASATRTHIDDTVVETLRQTKWFFRVSIALYAGARLLTTSKKTEAALSTAITLIVLVQIGIWLQVAVRAAMSGWRKRQGTDPGAQTMAAAIAFVTQLAVWSIILVLALANLGIEVGALVAGLGVGGVAAALAVQNVLSDVFASLSIYFDRPFDLGDFIIVGSELGTVEEIGMRSTRVRSLGGEQIIFSNADLTRSRIRNYKRMQERRVVFSVGVEYNVPLEAVEAIPQILRDEVEKQERVRFDRAHFKAYGATSLEFEIVYYVLSPDYNVYMDIQQAINFGIYRRFSERKIPFALPTRTLYVRQEHEFRIASSNGQPHLHGRAGGSDGKPSAAD